MAGDTLLLKDRDRNFLAEMLGLESMESYDFMKTDQGKVDLKNTE